MPAAAWINPPPEEKSLADEPVPCTLLDHRPRVPQSHSHVLRGETLAFTGLKR
jgi:hypothetical protein